MKKRGFVGVVIVGVLAALVVGGLIGLGLLGGSNGYRGGALDKATGDGGCVSPFYPNVTNEDGFATAINSYIAKLSPDSPFNGKGKLFVEAGKKYNINPAWVINTARKESGFGLNGGRLISEAHNAFGRTALESQPHIHAGNRLWYVYDSFDSSIDPQTIYMKHMYTDRGGTTIEKAITLYAPAKENNTALYIAQLNQWIGDVITSAGSAITCGSSNATAAGKGSDGVPLFRQTDYKQAYGDCQPANQSTISSSGCGPTSAAMVLKYYGKDVDPIITSKYSVDHGFRDCGKGTAHALFSSLANAYGLKYKQVTIDANTVTNYLKNKQPLIATGHGANPFSSGGHFIVLTGINSSTNEVRVNNPSANHGDGPFPLSEVLSHTTGIFYIGNK